MTLFKKELSVGVNTNPLLSWSAAVVVFSSVMLGGCSLLPKVPVPGMDRIVGEEGMFRDRKEEYLEADSIPRLEIPAGLDGYMIDDLLVIPELPDNTYTAFPDAPRPLPLQGSSEREVVIQKMGDTSWIIADVSPSQIWPRIRDYWRKSGIPITMENPQAGIMDTGWFELESEPLLRDRVRISVETGFQNASSEIRLLQMSAPKLMPVVTEEPWPETSADVDKAYDLLLSLSTYLAEVADLYQASTVSFLAGNISSQGKASLATTSAGNQLLELDAGFDRSWAAVRRSLTRSEIEITGEDFSAGYIDVSFDPNKSFDDEEEDKPGFFKKVITLGGLFSGDENADHVPLRLQLLPISGHVEVLAVPFETNKSAAATDASNRLITLIRNTIA